MAVAKIAPHVDRNVAVVTKETRDLQQNDQG